jgi:hypothetical protein
MIAVFIVAMLLGVLTARVSTIGARGGIEPTRRSTAFIAFIAMLATFAIIVWGFASLSWYWPVGTFLVVSVLAGFAISRENWSFWYQVNLFLQLAVILIATYLWCWHWPF